MKIIKRTIPAFRSVFRFLMTAYIIRNSIITLINQKIMV